MKKCDLIMKGGITSGVVYPKAITTLAKDYRFINIGGTSAGAIGAVIAAAAEYRRQASHDANKMDGFKEIEAIPTQLGEHLLDLFVPYPPLAALFKTVVDLTAVDEGDNKLRVLIWGLVKHHPRTSIFMTLITAGVTGLLLRSGQYGWAAFGLLVCLITFLGIIMAYMKTAITVHFKDNHFGMCTGTKVPSPSGNKLMSFLRKIYWKEKTKAKIEPFADWMNYQIDKIAFGDEPTNTSPPLTVGHLRKYGIEICSITTDLSSRRPYQLPFESKEHYFKKEELERLMPPNIMTHLLKGKEPVAYRENDDGVAHPDDSKEYYPFCISDEMPVLLIARLSLSFPGLISAIPLYRRDYGLRESMGGYVPLKQCLFSDGGISSNFPIHFFDDWLPSRPTFGINLTSFDLDRVKKDEINSQATDIENRVHLPLNPRSSRNLPVIPVANVFGFMGSIVNTAKDWQDVLQSYLPGYAERVVDIRLSNNEGGMNLSMPSKLIDDLTKYGELAGDKLRGFNFSEHCYRRAITTVPYMEESLVKFSAVYGEKDWQSGSGCNWTQIFEDYKPSSYKGLTKTWRQNNLHEVAKSLNEIGEAGQKELLRENKNVPYMGARVRMVASPLSMNREIWEANLKSDRAARTK